MTAQGKEPMDEAHGCQPSRVRWGREGVDLQSEGKILRISSNRMYQVLIYAYIMEYCPARKWATNYGKFLKSYYTNMDKSQKPHTGLKQRRNSRRGPPENKSLSVSSSFLVWRKGFSLLDLPWVPKNRFKVNNEDLRECRNEGKAVKKQ